MWLETVVAIFFTTGLLCAELARTEPTEVGSRAAALASVTSFLFLILIISLEIS